MVLSTYRWHTCVYVILVCFRPPWSQQSQMEMRTRFRKNVERVVAAQKIIDFKEIVARQLNTSFESESDYEKSESKWRPSCRWEPIELKWLEKSESVSQGVKSDKDKVKVSTWKRCQEAAACSSWCSSAPPRPCSCPSLPWSRRGCTLFPPTQTSSSPPGVIIIILIIT